MATLEDHLQWLRQKAADAATAAEQKAAETPVQTFLPGLDEVMRAMPNHIAVLQDLYKPTRAGSMLDFCFTEAGFVPILRLEPEPSSPQTDTVELTA